MEEQMRIRMKYIVLLLLLSVIITSLVGCSSTNLNTNATEQKEKSTTSQKTDIASNTTEQDIKTEEEKDNSLESENEIDAKAIDWNAPSNGTYPTVKDSESIWIDVSVDEQKVYIKNQEDTLYTMTASTGLDTSSDNSTPKGTYYIEPERGEWFFSSGYQQGAQYWVSWKNHGEFLFHSVPMDENQQVIESEAKKLGEKASHGCIRLTVSDAKWIYDHIKTNTKVVIRS